MVSKVFDEMTIGFGLNVTNLCLKVYNIENIPIEKDKKRLVVKGEF